MIHLTRAEALCHYRCALPKRSFGYRFLATKTYEPLRILFCGADEFSIASLKALHEEHLKRPDRISSIDVVCRPGKRVGRGLKKIREGTLSTVKDQCAWKYAHSFNLMHSPHQGGRNGTFTSNSRDRYIQRLGAPNTARRSHQSDSSCVLRLIRASANPQCRQVRWIECSSIFASRVRTSKSWAVPQEASPNVRMSSFRGPAPLHHTLLAGRTKTGVTLQTLHLKHFDHGVILQQTPAPGFEIPNPDACTVPELLNIVAPKGAEILLDGIRKGLFVPPTEDAGWRASQSDEPLIHAAKIKPEDRHIDWVNWSWEDINRRKRVLGPLWSKTLAVGDPASGNPSLQQRRVILSEMEEVDTLKGCEAFSLVPGLPFVDSAHPIDRQQAKGLYVFTRDGKLIRIHQMKVEGEQNADGVRAALKARMLSDRTFNSGAADFTPFHNPLQ